MSRGHVGEVAKHINRLSWEKLGGTDQPWLSWKGKYTNISASTISYSLLVLGLINGI